MLLKVQSPASFDTMTFKILTRSHPSICSLLEEGYSLESIVAATMEADNISRERAQSANKQNWDKVNEVSERFSKLFTKALRNKREEPKKSTLAAHSA